MTHKTTYKAEYYGRWLRRTAVALFLLILTIFLFIASGHLDPLTKDIPTLPIQPTTLTLAPQSKLIEWQSPLPTPPYTIRLIAALESGAVDSGYGFVLGDAVDHFGVAVAPTGYLTIWQTGAQTAVVLPWQTWPHVQTGNMSNEIWLEMTADSLVTIRVNHELLWSGAIDLPSGKIGLYGESFSKTAVINYQPP